MQKTDTVVPPSRPKPTRIQVEFVRTRTDQSGAGGAETGFAECPPSPKTTRPPSVVQLLTVPAPVSPPGTGG
ncbi:hypothetical protein ACFV8T_03700 [Streptomyces sp. NPDC059832]|uniref:hypothetical protein n=1 Tax=Streptomyces sp. NPDC059832 TaxID=3346966 RepID=UPI00364D23E7